jgi:hypothetical protein
LAVPLALELETLEREDELIELERDVELERELDIELERDDMLEREDELDRELDKLALLDRDEEILDEELAATTVKNALV